MVDVGDLVLLSLLLPLLLPPELLRHPLALALRLVELDGASPELLTQSKCYSGAINRNVLTHLAAYFALDSRSGVCVASVGGAIDRTGHAHHV